MQIVSFEEMSESIFCVCVWGGGGGGGNKKNIISLSSAVYAHRVVTIMD